MVRRQQHIRCEASRGLDRIVLIVLALFGLMSPAIAQVCSPTVNTAPGDLFAVDAARMYRVAEGVYDDCVGTPAALRAISFARDGRLFGLSSDESLVYILDPTTDNAPGSVPIPAHVIDLTVAESGEVALLAFHGTMGGRVWMLDPDDGSIRAFSPPPLPSDDPLGTPTSASYLGAGDATPTGIALAPNGTLLVAQVTPTHCEIVRIADDGSQSLDTFIPPDGAIPTALGIDVLPSGRPIVVTDDGVVFAVGLRGSPVEYIGTIGGSSAFLDVAVVGVRHAYIACGALYNVRWDTTGITLLQSIDDVDEVVSLAPRRGVVGANDTIIQLDFENASGFTDNFYVERTDDDARAEIISYGSSQALRLQTGTPESLPPAPVSVITELHVPYSGISLSLDYLFRTRNARIDVFVNRRRACSIVPPPSSQAGGPAALNFAGFTHHISLDRLGLRRAPRLIVELRLVSTINTASIEALEIILDNLTMRSGDCGILFGDLNFDGALDLCDIEYLAANYGAYDPCNDLNQDGYVDAFDFTNLLQIVERRYLGNCTPPVRAPRLPIPVDDTSPITEGNLLIAAKDAEWNDWIYEVSLDPPTCQRKFRMPGSEDYPAVYTQIRHDGHGTVHAVDFNGMIERWTNADTTLDPTWLWLEPPDPADLLAGLAPVDIAVTRGQGLWINYAPNAYGFGREAVVSQVAHYNDDLMWAGAYSAPEFTRGRALLTSPVGKVWAVTADMSNFDHDLLCDLAEAPMEYFEISGVNATTSAQLSPSEGWLNVGSAATDTVNMYPVSAGMQQVSHPPSSTWLIPNCTAVTGVAEDPIQGDLYACGFEVVGPNPWRLAPRLAVLRHGHTSPQVIALDTGDELIMPVGIICFRTAPPGDFNANFTIELHDLAAMQACYAEPSPTCLEDFDMDDDQDLDGDDIAAFMVALEEGNL